MYKFDWIYKNPNISKWTNSKEYIVLHHTGSIWAGNIKILAWTPPSKVSVHFLVMQDGKAYKMAEPDQITRHAWESEWGSIDWLNPHSLGIEIEGNSDSKFSDTEYNKVVDLVKYLMKAFNIPKENVIKHSDITRSGSKDKKLWDWKSKARKTDLAPRFRQDRWYKTYSEWRDKVLVV